MKSICLAVFSGFVLDVLLFPSATTKASGTDKFIRVQRVNTSVSTPLSTPIGNSEQVVGFSCVRDDKLVDCYVAIR